MKASSFKYLTKQGFSNFKENKLMSVASVGVVCSCLIIVGVCAMIVVNINSFVSYLGSQNEIVIFLKDEASTEELSSLENFLTTNENINTFTYVSKDEALTEQMTYMGDFSGLLEGYRGENNPMPASYRCRIKNLEDLEKTSREISTFSGIDYISTPLELANVLITIKNVSYYGGLSVLAILVMVSMVVISNTIRLTVFARRKEISIMKYVGATDGFIRMPFVVEGLIIGTLSAVFSFAFISIGYTYVLSYISMEATGFIATVLLSLVPYSVLWLPMLVGFLLAGTFIGGIGSMISMQKYLKV